MYAYFNNGKSMRSVADGHVAEEGEILFADIPTTEQLSDAFDGYATFAAQSARIPLINAAKEELAKNDIVLARCGKANPPVEFPTDWREYDAEIRLIADGSDTSSTQLPSRPDYPPGT